jgi:hypothetical protein
MCWLNTDSQHICEIAILGQSNHLPWAAAKVCFQHQRDFNYLEMRHLWEDARVDAEGIHLSGMHYKALIVDRVGTIPPQAKPALQALAQAGRLIAWQDETTRLAQIVHTRTAQELCASLDKLIPPDIVVEPAQPDLRYRHVIKSGIDYYILCNEGMTTFSTTLQTAVDGAKSWFDPYGVHEVPATDPLTLELEPYATKIVQVARRQL